MFRTICLTIIACITITSPLQGWCAAHTLIKTPKNYTPIENLKPHDIIIGYDMSLNQTREDSVVRISKMYSTGNIIKIYTDQAVITVSEDQLFYNQINQSWVAARNLTKGSYIFTLRTGSVEIINVESGFVQIPFYKLTIQKGSTFFATQQDILVYN